MRTEMEFQVELARVLDDMRRVIEMEGEEAPLSVVFVALHRDDCVTVKGTPQSANEAIFSLARGIEALTDKDFVGDEDGEEGGGNDDDRTG